MRETFLGREGKEKKRYPTLISIFVNANVQNIKVMFQNKKARAISEELELTIPQKKKESVFQFVFTLNDLELIDK